MRLSLPALLAAAVAAGCADPKTPDYVRSSGTVALAKDDSRLFVADTDNDQVAVIDARAESVLKLVPVGSHPQGLAVSPDGTVYVANRLDRTVSVISGSTLAETKRLPVDVEPWGVAVSPDGKRLYVACAAGRAVVNDDPLYGADELAAAGIGAGETPATVLAFDTASFDRAWSRVVRAEARNLTVTADGRIWVSHFTNGKDSLTVLHADGGREPGLQIHRDFSTDPVPGGPPIPRPLGITTTSGNQVGPVAQAPNGSVVAPYVAERDGVVVTTSPNAYGGGSSSSGQPTGPIVAPRVALVSPSGEVKQVATPASAPSEGTASGGGALPFNMPVAAVVDASGEWIFVANQGSNNVAILSASGRTRVVSAGVGAWSVVNVGSAPTGIALSADGRAAYVHNAFDYSVSVLRQGKDGEVVQANVIRFGQRPASMDEAVERGRRLFFSASDTRMTNPSFGGISCGGCHPQAGTDNHVFVLTEGPRNTPSVAGRHISQTKPYHWDGAIATIHDLQAEVQTRMGGEGLAPTEFDAIEAFMDWTPTRDNPYRAKDGSYTAAQARGRQVFVAKSNCTTCHRGDQTTDNQWHGVGTFATSMKGTGLPVHDTFGIPDSNDSQSRPGVNTPSLSDLWFTGPYLHDGRYGSLEAQLDKANPENGFSHATSYTPYGAHGDFASLDAQDLADLAAYLRTL